MQLGCRTALVGLPGLPALPALGAPRRSNKPLTPRQAQPARLAPLCALQRSGSSRQQRDLSPSPLLNGFQALFLTAFSAFLATLTRQRAVFDSMLLGRLPLPLSILPAVNVVALFLREGLMFWISAALAWVTSWSVWRLTERKPAPLPELQPPPRLLPPPATANGEDQEMRRLKFELYRARQDASDAKHALKSLQQGDLVRQLEERSAELRMMRLEAAAAKEELARVQSEAQALSNIVASTLDSISDGYEEDDEAGEEEKRAWQAASPRSAGAGAGAGAPGSPVADANSLQAKVAFLSRRAMLAALHRHEVNQLRAEMREADLTITALKEELATVRRESQHARDVSQALQQHLGSTQQENKELRVAAVKAERHLDAYDRMVVRLEDMVEQLEEDKKALRERLGALESQPATDDDGSGGGFVWGSNGAKPAAA